MNLLLPISAACALGLAACATTREASVATSAEAQADLAAQRDSERFCLRETGTRIVVDRARDTKDRKRCVIGNGRVYTREQLEMTGRLDIADALRALDPRIR